MNYTEGFKARMVERLSGPDAKTALALHREVGVAQTTLSKWLREARRVPSMGNKESQGARGPKKWNGIEKLQVVLEAASIPDAELGEFLRRKGIHEADLKAWREVVAQAATEAFEGGRKDEKRAASAERRVKELESDLAKKDKRLRAVNALLELQKKVQEIWGAADDPTQPKSEP